MKVYNIVTFLLIGLATATRPPYNLHQTSTSAKAQVGKAILVRIPLDADATPSQYYQTGNQGEYHEPQSSPSREASRLSKHQRDSQSHSYGYGSKLPEAREQYQEPQNAGLTRPASVSYGHQTQGYGYRSTIPQSDNRQKLVFLVPEANRESGPSGNSGYESQSSYPSSTATVQNYGARRPTQTQQSEDIVYSKQLPSPTTKYQDKKATYQSSNKEHHKVPLILITLKDDNKAVKANQQSRRIPPGYGKSWQPMSSETTSFINQNKQSYEPESLHEKNVQNSHGVSDSWRVNQGSGITDWPAEQPIRQESKEESSQSESNPWRQQIRPNDNNQWQSQSVAAGVHYEKPQRNQQSTDEGYGQWKRPQPSLNKPAFTAGYSSGQSDSALSNSEKQRPEGDGYYGSNVHLEQNYRQTTTEPRHQHRKPVETDVQKSYEQRPTQPESGLSSYNQQPLINGFQPQNSDSTYQQQSSNGRYPQSAVAEARYPQGSGSQPSYAQSSRAEVGYKQSSGAQSRYPQSSGAEAGYTQSSGAQSRYPQSSGAEDGYTQSSGAQSRYPQTSGAEAGYTQSSGAEAGYTQSSGAEAGYTQSSGAQSRYPQTSGAEAGYPQSSGAQSRYPQPSGVETGYTQSSGVKSRQPFLSGTENRYPQSSRDESTYPPKDTNQQYPEQFSSNDRYPQTVTESRIPQESTESPLAQQNREKIPQSELVSNYPQRRPSYQHPTTEITHQQQPVSNSRYPEASLTRVYGSGYGGANVGADVEEQTRNANSQQEQSWNNQPTTNSPKEETWTRPNVALNNQNTNWGQATSYNPRDEPNRENQGSYSRKEVRSHGYAGHQSSESRPGDSWETQASSERTVKTRAEKTKGVVLLLLSNDDKDVYARRAMEVPEGEESMQPSPTNA